MSVTTQNYIFNIIRKGYLPKYLVVLIDLSLFIVNFLFASLLFNNFNLDILFSFQNYYLLLFLSSLYLLSFFIFQSYQGAFRYTGMRDIINLFLASVFATSIAVSLPGILKFAHVSFPRPRISLLLLTLSNFNLSVFGVRLIVKLFYSRYALSLQNAKSHVNILIYGANNDTIALKNALATDKTLAKNVIGYIDPRQKIYGKKIDGTPVYSVQQVLNPQFLQSNNIREIIWSLHNQFNDDFKTIGEYCIQNNILFNKIPQLGDWVNAENKNTHIKPVKIEELLNRTVINLDNQKLEQFFHNKTILVTGAAGSIGSEISRQLLYYKPKNLILLDNAETPLHDLSLELSQTANHPPFITLICDITRADRVNEIFQQYQPQMVFHAAAYKHVPLMENNPREAVKTNLDGTRIVAQAATQNHCQKFVFISSDKAVNPTNVMGATKRAAEILLKTQQPHTQTEFITTRFGNVLGSNGSVIPIFKKQIENRQNITVTHRDIIRYFMTIPEACQLVFEAASMGHGGEIFAFDMGEPVNIYDLAEKMIKLSGLIKGKDIDIIETGLRPGEKLFEELLGDSENTQPTHHPKIMIAKDSFQDQYLDSNFLWLQNNHYAQLSEKEVVMELKKLIPEYKSQNSQYAALDA